MQILIYSIILAFSIFALIPLRIWQQEYLAYYSHFLLLMQIGFCIYFLYQLVFFKRNKKYLLLSTLSGSLFLLLFIPIYPFCREGTLKNTKLHDLESQPLKVAFFPVSDDSGLEQFFNLGLDPDLLILHSRQKNSVFDGFYSNYEFKEVYSDQRGNQYCFYAKLPISNLQITDLEVADAKLLSIEIEERKQGRPAKAIKIYSFISKQFTAAQNHNLDLLNRRLATMLRAEHGRVIFANSMFATPYNKSYSRLLKGANFKHVAWGHFEFLMNFDLLQNHLLHKGKVARVAVQKLGRQGYLADFVLY